MKPDGQAPPVKAEVELPMMQRNPYMCLAIVAALATVALIATVGLVLCAVLQRPVPESLVAISSMSVGGLAGALSVSGQIRTLTAPAREVLR